MTYWTSRGVDSIEGRLPMSSRKRSHLKVVSTWRENKGSTFITDFDDGKATLSTCHNLRERRGLHSVLLSLPQGPTSWRFDGSKDALHLA